MADIRMCEPLQLYNLINQRRTVSRLAEINYLCLIDAREPQDYNVSHIITSKNVTLDSEGTLFLPASVEVDSMQHIVIYDCNSISIEQQGRAVRCAQALAKVSLYPVCIVKGGFQRFSALYPFLRTEKILYTIHELENLPTYPVEVIAELLYMGDLKQALDSRINKDLKIRAVVSSSETEIKSSIGNQSILNIPVADSAVSDLCSSFEKICDFIGSHINKDSRVLIVSTHGNNHCSAVTIAFLMHHLKYTLQEAWSYMLTCKPDMRLSTPFLQQLSDWELHTRGSTITDISQLSF